MDLEKELKACGVDLEPAVFVDLILQVIRNQRQILSRRQSSGPLTKEERAAYIAGGFDLKKRSPNGPSPLARPLAELAAIVVEAFTVKAAAELLSLHPASIRRDLRSRSLYGIHVGGRWLLPRFQFDGGQALPNLGEVLREMDPDLQPLTVSRFFMTPQEELVAEHEPLCPRDWLLRGLPARPLCALARGISIL